LGAARVFLRLILPTASPVVAVVKGGSVADRKKDEAVKRKEFEAEALPHMDALYRTALRLAKNQSDAEDLVQEAYAKAYRFWDKFELGSNCRAWLFKIMTNIFINEYRSKSRSPLQANIDDIDDNYLYGQLTTEELTENPEQALFSKIFDDDVKKAIESLPDDFRLVAVLSFLEGFSYQEIAEIADLQLGTVKSRLHRGRKLLQKQLFDYAVKNGYIKEKAK
jgi:RNA polymerase sigma-70 factor (ECF subfamily)